MRLIFPLIRMEHTVPSTGQGCFINIRLMPDVVMTGDSDAMTDFWSQDGDLGVTTQLDLSELPNSSVTTEE